MKKKKIIIIIDDDKAFLKYLKGEITNRFDCLKIKTYDNPFKAFKAIHEPFDLIFIDWEMKQLDGRKFLNYAKEIGIPFHKIIIVSAKGSKMLHKAFEHGEVLTVINKTDPEQMKALFMIIDNIRCL